MTGDAPIPFTRPYSRAARASFVLALCTAALMFPLVLVGAGVTTRDFGMAYPDWPTSAGHIVNPPNWWNSLATRWEHGHRLIGWTVGIFATALLVVSWRCGGAIRILASSGWIAIGLQGVLGGLRVRHVSRELAMVHGVWGQVALCVMCAAVLVSSRRWALAAGALEVPSVVTLRRVSVGMLAAFLVQLCLGALRRHFGGDHALIAHVLWAVVLSLLVGWVVVWVIGQHPGRDIVETLGWLLGGLMSAQLALGGVTWALTLSGPVASTSWLWLVPTLHVAFGAALSACAVLLTLCSFRFLRVPDSAPRSNPLMSPVSTT